VKYYKKHYHRYNNLFIPGIAVVVQNGNVDAALRKFKKKVQEEGIIQEVRSRQEYVKPSEKRRKAKAASRARMMKKLGLK
jgi:small subunit ribosomal protein S21|tara:strand:+ start:27499 stop:27738 length:240 start_codon:yes stop_codon:yes gene_type:complete